MEKIEHRERDIEAQVAEKTTRREEFAMKLDDEDLRPDREVGFQTDDEENQAEMVCEDEGEDTESDNENFVTNTTTWPQSYRASMDMLTSVTPPPISFLRGSSAGLATGSPTSAYRRRQYPENDSSLTECLVSNRNLENGDSHASTLPAKLSVSSHSISSHVVFPTSDNRSSYTQAVLNGINILCGIGLLTTPYAIKEGGWLSLLILLLFCIVCCYTGILMKRCLESTPGLHTYPDIGHAAFGVPGRLAISIMLYVELYASAVEYVIMMSDNLIRLFPNAQTSFAGMHLNAHRLFPIASTLAVLPTVWLRDLSLLSYLSVGGVVASILVAFSLLWVGVVDKVGFHPQGKALDLANLPVAIGIYGFGFSGHSVFPNIYSSMKKPSEFSSVLVISFIFCGLIYTGVAICGYLMFGDSVQSQYTLNMPTEFPVSKVALWTAVVNPMTKYALTLIPVALSLEELMPPGLLRSYSMSITVRTILTISTMIVALTFPFFGFLMALIGSLLATLIAIIIPCACYLSILRGRLSKLQVAVCIFTIVLGATTGCIGTYSSISRILSERR